ncbi:MAG: hypothetical protein GX491_14210 [Chloroflexi bacterium]|nr:hypothetical protein [Chloroflexota bacterium]
MRTKRLFFFLIMILVGLGLGLLYGWVINPVKYVNTPLHSLRADYKTDYVLMVAEIYQSDQNLSQAVRRLSLLGSEDPLALVSESIARARSFGYTSADIEMMGQLSQALQPPSAGAQP